jgi:IMP dehydrogenase
MTDDPALVRDVMTTPLETISADATLKEAAVRMRKYDINGLFVPGISAGIVTTTDVTEAVAENKDPSEVTVGEEMTAPVEKITTEEELTQAAAMMTNFRIKHLPVVDTDGDFVGMVSMTDLTSHLA